ncbi:MAG: Fic family protein [Propionibacteriaceae bacterium]
MPDGSGFVVVATATPLGCAVLVRAETHRPPAARLPRHPFGTSRCQPPGRHCLDSCTPDQYYDGVPIVDGRPGRFVFGGGRPVQLAPHPHATPEEGPGNWREHEIAPFSGGMKPPPFPEVAHLMLDWVTFVNTLRAPDAQTPFPERLAQVHNTFERIHPFLDGNGRTGRLLLNLILVRLGYPPAIIFKNERIKYLSAMGKADAGDLGPMGELISRSITNNLYRFVDPRSQAQPG